MLLPDRHNECEQDWILPEGDSCWVQVGPFAIWIRHVLTTDNKHIAAIEVLPHGKEMENAIDSLWVEE